MAKPLPPVKCHGCGRWVYEARLTLPRKVKDLVFCNFQCQEVWREGERVDALLLEEE